MSFNNAEFVVTRQRSWPDGELYVEIAQGGQDYSNPGCLVTKYGRLGEGDVFTGMTAALEAGLAIYKAWKADSPNETIGINAGCTHGDTMFFDPVELDEQHEAKLRQRAESFDSKLDRCEHCGEIITGEKYGCDGEYNCCSEYCAEEYHRAPTDEEETEDDEEETDDEECVSEV